MGLFFFYFRLFNTQLTVYKCSILIIFCRWLDSNRRPQVSEATALPTKPQPLPFCKTSFFLLAAPSQDVFLLLCCLCHCNLTICVRLFLPLYEPHSVFPGLCLLLSERGKNIEKHFEVISQNDAALMQMASSRNELNNILFFSTESHQVRPLLQRSEFESNSQPTIFVIPDLSWLILIGFRDKFLAKEAQLFSNFVAILETVNFK